MKGDRCSFTDDLDGRGYVAPVRPLVRRARAAEIGWLLVLGKT